MIERYAELESAKMQLLKNQEAEDGISRMWESGVNDVWEFIQFLHNDGFHYSPSEVTALIGERIEQWVGDPCQFPTFATIEYRCGLIDMINTARRVLGEEF